MKKLLANLKLYYRISIYDKNGKLEKKGRLRRSKSFVIAFLQFQQAFMAHAYNVDVSAVTIKDTSNVNQVTPHLTNKLSVSSIGVNAPAATSTYGIAIGTGTDPPTNTDYTMQTQIAHGVGATQMQYGGCSCGVAGVVGDNVDMAITRPFVNSSGGTITIKECGIIITSQNSVAAQKFFLIVRDSADQAVENTKTATVTYILRTTV